MQHHRAILLERLKLGPHLYSLALKLPRLKEVKPGQFFEFATGVTFLRRALSVADREGTMLRFVFRVVGPGTRWLADLPQGAELDLAGPLGNGVELPKKGLLMLLAGGVGAAPLLYLARRLNEKKLKVHALLAAETEDELMLIDEFRSLCSEVSVATDDGSFGQKGYLTDVLPTLPNINEFSVFYACGPEPMLAALKRLGLKQPVYAFLESRMGCGTGLCLGCAVRGRDGRYHRVCLEGPVFDLEEIEP